MDVTIAEARTQLDQLIEAVQRGSQVLITSEGKPVAQLSAPPPVPTRREVRLGTMRDRIQMKPGWDAPITEEQFFSGDY